MVDGQIMVSSRLMAILHRLNHQLEGRGLEWALVGSLGLSIRGAKIEPKDVDIITDKNGAYEIERIFSECAVSPVSLKSSDLIRSYFGELNLDGVKVEIMGDFQICLKDGTWMDPPDIQALLEFEPIDGMLIPVLSLEWEYDSYSKLGRPERAEAVKAIMIERAHRKDRILLK